MTSIADRIMLTMKKANITYVELAKRTGISKSALQRYATGETEKIPLDRVEMIASCLNVAPEYLLGWSEQETLKRELPVDSIYRQFKYVTDEISSLSQVELPSTGVNTYQTTEAINKIMEINNAILHTPRISVATNISDAIVGLKFILCYLHFDWRKCEDSVFSQVIDSDIFKDILKNLLNLYDKSDDSNN